MNQRSCIKLCVKKEIKCARTFEILAAAFGESTMSRTQVQLWYNRFKATMKTTDKNIEAMKKMILDNRRIAIK